MDFEMDIDASDSTDSELHILVPLVSCLMSAGVFLLLFIVGVMSIFMCKQVKDM